MGKLADDLDRFEKVEKALEERARFEGWYDTKAYKEEWSRLYRKIILRKRE